MNALPPTSSPTRSTGAGHPLATIVPELALPPLSSAALDERLTRATRIWRLTPRMTETLLLLVSGLDDHQIARCRERSVPTIENQVAGLLRRAGVDSRARLIAQFWR